MRKDTGQPRSWESRCAGGEAYLAGGNRPLSSGKRARYSSRSLKPLRSPLRERNGIERLYMSAPRE